MKRPLKSIYIHMPFCKSKCNYCSFVSYSGKESLIKAYFKALHREIDAKMDGFANNNLETLYIGGGTPSVIDHAYYKQLLSAIILPQTAEITIEVNPGTVSYEYLKNLRHAGFNRLSIGVQSFDNKTLQTLGRIHTVQESLATVKEAKNAGFENISIDLMYGLPEQTLKGWEETVLKALELDVNHISTYCLKIEEGTMFFHKLPNILPDEDATSEMFLKTSKILSENGFEHYEISNFAKKGCESRHNLAYWRNQEYFGFGAGAHGYVNGVRYSNKPNLEEYIANPLQPASQNTLSNKEIIEEGIFLGLRLAKGIDIAQFRGEYGIDIPSKYASVIEKYVSCGLMEFKNGMLRLTINGMLVSNTIMAEFLE